MPRREKEWAKHCVYDKLSGWSITKLILNKCFVLKISQFLCIRDEKFQNLLLWEYKHKQFLLCKICFQELIESTFSNYLTQSVFEKYARFTCFSYRNILLIIIEKPCFINNCL